MSKMKITDKMMDGCYLVKQAQKTGLKTKNGKGDHVIIYAPVKRGYMVVPYRKMGKGLASAIVKWLIAAGVSFIFILYFWF